MARVKTGTISKNKRIKILKQAKGYRGAKSKRFRSAKEQVMHSDMYAYRDRKQNKRNFRKLWITRINAGCRANDISYSKFMHGLKNANVDLNRKVLSELAINDADYFSDLVKLAKENLEITSKPSSVKTEKAVKTEKKENIEKIDNSIKEEKAVKEEPKREKQQSNLDDLTVVELKELAKEKELSGYSTLRKQELIDFLNKQS